MFSLQVYIGTHNGNRRFVNDLVWPKVSDNRSPPKRVKNLASFFFTDQYLKDKSLKIKKCHNVRPGQEERTELSTKEICLFIRMLSFVL